MKRACLVSSTSGYNVGLEKMGNWLRRTGWDVRRRPAPDIRADLYAFSVIFSWDIPRTVGWVNWVKGQGDVEIGGPAMTNLAGFVQRLTGVQPHIGPDYRFEEEPGDYKLVRTSRGCPVGCYFCIVPRMDGTEMRLYPECSLPSGPTCAIVDDNFIVTPESHQERIVDRLRVGGYRAIDFNSGLEPRSWSTAVFERLSKLPLTGWRLAFDEVEEADEVQRLMTDLRGRGVNSRKIWVYVLAGGKEPFEKAKWRADKVIEWGGEPRIQPYKPLTWMKKRSEPFVSKGWTREQVVNLPRYYYGYSYRTMSFEDFCERTKARSAHR